MAPSTTDPSVALWQAWAAGHLCLQGCTDCSRLRHPPSQLCPECHSTHWSLVDVAPCATLVSWSTVHRAPAPAFAGDVPYTVAIVSIGDAALLEARVDPALPPAALSPGMQVGLTLGEIAGRAMPIVRPA